MRVRSKGIIAARSEVDLMIVVKILINASTTITFDGYH